MPRRRSARAVAGLVTVLTALVALWACAPFLLEALYGRPASSLDPFSAISALFSAVALAGLVATLYAQQRDAAEQQRANTALLTSALKSGNAAVRQAHVELLRMAMEDTSLMEVWPAFAGLSATNRRQLVYANLILQHQAMAFESGLVGPEFIGAEVLRLMDSPSIRRFWEIARAVAQAPGSDSPEGGFAGVVEAQYQAWLGAHRSRSGQPD